MSTPRTRPESPAEALSPRGGPTATIERDPATAGQGRSDAELRMEIESAASRLLGLALARGIEERDPDEE